MGETKTKLIKIPLYFIGDKNHSFNSMLFLKFRQDKVKNTCISKASTCNGKLFRFALVFLKIILRALNKMNYPAASGRSINKGFNQF